ncbi:NAD(P)H-binding protein [Streptomyces sp. SID8014]|uniref:NmrA family NAD(P)-binding protein n=1 Tax=Streptomyces sp. SID8014 TaxID=2706097 RepID=UPI0013BE79A4|nr:NAD(P)H-binding protein [Streptomyces sp. SID8014]
MTATHEVLVTGSTGNTGRPLVARLRAQGVPTRAASRHPSPDDHEATRFDWYDPTTFDNAVAGVRAAYLVPPPLDPDPVAAMAPFLEAAQRSGVSRVVLLGASVVETGGPAVGQVQALLPRHVQEWVVLRPSWFMQNFVGDHHHADSARTLGTITTAAGDGRVAFIDADDIAAVAARLLTAPTVTNEELVLTGPEALSHTSVAEILTDVLGRRVRHVSVPASEFERQLAATMPAPGAKLLAALDRQIAAGVEDRTTPGVERVTGRPPKSMRTVLEAAFDAGRR